MKTLVVFYSRTGTTRKVGEEIVKMLGADIEEIIDLKNRSGPIGWLGAGRDAMKKKVTDIKEIVKNPKDYDLVIIGTPNWGASIAPAVRTFLEKYKNNIKKAAFFCTMGGESPGKIFIQMEEIIGKPISTLAIREKELKNNDYINKLEGFINNVKGSVKNG
jgi:flavodoxin